MERRRTFAILCTVIFISAMGWSDAAGSRILIYDNQAGDYSFTGKYSVLFDALKSEGYVIEHKTTGEITKDLLKDYDLLILQNLNRKLSGPESIAIHEFVSGTATKKGNGLFINGGAPSVVNSLSLMFGIARCDAAECMILEDSPELKTTSGIIIDNFNRDDPKIAALIKGVSRISMSNPYVVYKTSDVTTVASGSETAYTTSVNEYPKGSHPPVFVMSFYKGGIVVVNQDITMFDNGYISSDDFDNKKFVSNLIEELITSRTVLNANETCQASATKYMGIYRLKENYLERNGEIRGEINQTKELIRSCKVTEDACMNELDALRGPQIYLGEIGNIKMVSIPMESVYAGLFCIILFIISAIIAYRLETSKKESETD